MRFTTDGVLGQIFGITFVWVLCKGARGVAYRAYSGLGCWESAMAFPEVGLGVLSYGRQAGLFFGLGSG